MKVLIAVFFFAVVSLTLFSRDITTVTGTTYKDATVFDTNAAELVISYKNTSGWTVIKSIQFTDLPEDIRKEFNYDPVKGEAYVRGLKEWDKKNAELKAEAETQKKIDAQRSAEEAEKIIQEEQREGLEREKAALEKKNNPEAKEDDISKYANQLVGNTLTDMQKNQLLKEIKFKQVESCGTVKDVRRMNDSDMILVPGEGDVVLTHTQSNAWVVRIYNPDYPKNFSVFIVLYNYDTAKNLSKGEQIKFKGVLWRVNFNSAYLSPSTILK
jgi:hypothetical protein